MQELFLGKLTEVLKKNNVDAMLMAPSGELKFLAGLSLMLCERFQGLFIKQNGECFYVCNLLYKNDITEVYGDKLPIYTWHDNDGFIPVVKKAFEEHGLIGKTIAVNATVRAFNVCQIMANMDVKFVDGKDMAYAMSLIKDDEEQARLREASRLADEVFEVLVKFVKPGMTEGDVKNKIQSTFKDLGVNPAGSGGLVATGTHGAMPHYIGTSRVIEENDIVLLDYGCNYKGLCSDTTRTIFIGEPTPKQRECYELVKLACIAGEQAAKEGAYIPDIEAAARKVIEDGGYGQYFTHRLGHGIGYSGHELPEIKAINKMHLEKGMAFSIEPGIYIPDEFGIRIEDIVMINSQGETEVLNKTSKELIII